MHFKSFLPNKRKTWLGSTGVQPPQCGVSPSVLPMPRRSAGSQRFAIHPQLFPNKSFSLFLPSPPAAQQGGAALCNPLSPKQCSSSVWSKPDLLSSKESPAFCCGGVLPFVWKPDAYFPSNNLLSCLSVYLFIFLMLDDLQEQPAACGLETVLQPP